MYHPQFAPTRMKHNAMSSLKAQKSSFYVVDARSNFLGQLLICWSVTFLDEGRYDMVVK
jgi:hypothetical protein